MRVILSESEESRKQRSVWISETEFPLLRAVQIDFNLSANCSCFFKQVGAITQPNFPFMLTLGMFSFVFVTFIGCVWWACNDDGDGAR